MHMYDENRAHVNGAGVELCCIVLDAGSLDTINPSTQMF
jgi:hypothetical protein